MKKIIKEKLIALIGVAIYIGIISLISLYSHKEINMETEYKVLVWTKLTEYRCRYAVIWDNELYESNIPDLMATTATMEGLKSLNPSIDFSEVEILTVKLTDNGKK